MALCAAIFALALQRLQGQDSNTQSTPDQEQTYTGPSILSRDKSLIGERGGKLIDFRFYGELNGVYDSGLTPLVVNPQGDVPNFGGYGVEAGFGVIGSHSWVHDKLSLEYRGTYRHYAKRSYFDGTGQVLHLASKHFRERH